MARTRVRSEHRTGAPSGRAGGSRPAASKGRAPAGNVKGRQRSRPTVEQGRRPLTVAAPPAWRPILALVLSIGGLGVSTYLSIAHFAKIPLVCSGGGIVNCERVTTSAQSYFLGIPVAFLGLLFFVGMTAINLPVLWRAADRRIHIARLAMTVVGMCFVLYLVSAELLIIKNICLWCTSVHVITFVLFVLMMTTIPQMLGWTAGARSDA
jgi:uncharacterized membrane protein